MNAKIYSLDANQTGRDLFNSDPLKHLLSALEKLDTVPVHALKAANIPEFFYQNLIVAWREYVDWRDATTPGNWFTKQGGIDPVAIHNMAIAMNMTAWHAWLFIRRELETNHDVRAQLMQSWRVDAESIDTLLERAIADTDAFMNVFMKDTPSNDLPF